MMTTIVDPKAPWTSCPCCVALPPLDRLLAPPAFAAPCVDTHSHVHQSDTEPSGPQVTAVLAVDERCWDTVVAWCETRPLAVPGFGVHPWQVHELQPGWQTRLTAKLTQHPGAIVGEIGLCKCARNLRGPGAKARVWPQQLDAFAQQLSIAAALQRPASVHCVKAHSAVVFCGDGTS